MLSQVEVEKIVVINRQTAEVYIKKELLSEEKHDHIRNKVGPHYFIEIGSVESFETKLSAAQKDFPPNEKVEVLYQDRFEISSILGCILRFVLILLFWFFIMRIMRTA